MNAIKAKNPSLLSQILAELGEDVQSDRGPPQRFNAYRDSEDGSDSSSAKKEDRDMDDDDEERETDKSKKIQMP